MAYITPRGYLLELPEYIECSLAPSHTRSRRAHPQLKKPAVIGNGIYFAPIRTDFAALAGRRFPKKTPRRTGIVIKPPPVVGAGVYFRGILRKSAALNKRAYESFRHTPQSINPLLVGPFPRIQIPVNDINLSGLDPLVAQVDSDILYNHYFANDGRTYLEVQNTSLSSKTFTVISTAELDEIPVDDLVLTIGASSTKLYGPFNTYTFNRLYDDLPNVMVAFIDVSASGSLKFRAYRLP